MKQTATKKMIDFIRQGHKVSYDLMMSFVIEYTSIRTATAERKLREYQQKGVIKIHHKDNKLNSPVVAYEYIEEKQPEPIKEINKLF